MDPLKTAYIDLVRPFLPQANRDEQEIFLRAIQAYSTPGVKARFWRKKTDKDQTGKWVLPLYSGALVEDQELRRLVIIDPASDKIKTQDKIIKFGLEILVFKKGENFTEVHYTEVVFKKWASPNHQKPSPGMYDSIEEHQRYYSEVSSGIASPPILIGERFSAKKRVFYIDFIEKRALSSLKLGPLPYQVKRGNHEIPFTLQDLAKGLKQVASALVHLKKDKRVHSDVKYSNIFITQEGGCFYLGLADFELLAESGHFFDSEASHTYPFWDAVRKNYHMVTPFLDVYGFAQTLGCLLWGREFDKVANNPNCVDFDHFYHDWKGKNQGEDPIKLAYYAKGYGFIRKVKEQDQARAEFLNHPTIRMALQVETQRVNILKALEIDNLEAKDCYTLALELECLFIK